MDAKQFVNAQTARTMRGLVTLDFDLTTAIVDRVINSPGNLFYLDKMSTGICYVQGNTDQGYNDSPILASPGFSMTDEAGFSGFRFSSPAQPGKMLRVVIASGMTIKQGDAIQSGATATAIVSGGLNRSDADEAFIGWAFAPATALNNPHVQLWAPSMSPAPTKRVYVTDIVVSSSAAQTVYLSTTWLVALATLHAAGVSKLIGGRTAQAQGRQTNNVGLLTGAACGAYAVTASDPLRLHFDEPFSLPGNTGLLLMGGAVNTALTAEFQWLEK